jgi:hypothetical protein
LRTSARLTLILSFITVVFCGCQRDGGPDGIDPAAYEHLHTLYGIHPRLILPAGSDSTLAHNLETSHRWLWHRYLQDLPAKLQQSRDRSGDLGRGDGNLAADLAFAWRATGADSLLDAAKSYLLNLAARETWDPEYDLLHGHLLLGTAIAYDWLYGEMNRSQRSAVADRLGDEAQAQYEQITRNRAWYREQYLQNHAHVNFTGMAYAAVALYGEDARAQQWLAACEDFFPHVFELSPSDGGSIEGLSYGNYAMEFCLFYAELARTILGHDYYSSQWIENYPRYVLHSMLPAPREDEWAMTFGDSPRHGNSHGPEHQLFLIASRLNDPTAQWLGHRLIELQPDGIGSASWWPLVWYDPSVGESSPTTFPGMHRFSQLGQVMTRTAWQDTSAAMIGLKSGAFMGESNADGAKVDLGAAHGHPDAGSFQFYSGGKFLLIDPGYTYFKRTANHNTLLIKGAGQLGEYEPWFASAEALHYGHHPRLLETLSTTNYDYILADLAAAYHPDLNLRKALRHLVYVKPEDILLVVDELEMDEAGILFAWPADTLELTGLLRLEGGYVAGSRGSAKAVFAGPEGEYTIGVSYIDNYPGTGNYTLSVDGRELHEWQNRVQDTDTHLELLGKVDLAPGSVIEVGAEPMGRQARIVKLTASSPHVHAGRGASWLAHFDPSVTLERKFTWIEADCGGMAVDVHPLAPERRTHDWGPWTVKTGSNFSQTTRLEIDPMFSDSAVTMINMLYIRPSGRPPLQWVRASVLRSVASVRYYRDNVMHTITFNLDTHEVGIETQR